MFLILAKSLRSMSTLIWQFVIKPMTSGGTQGQDEQAVEGAGQETAASQQSGQGLLSGLFGGLGGAQSYSTASNYTGSIGDSLLGGSGYGAPNNNSGDFNILRRDPDTSVSTSWSTCAAPTWRAAAAWRRRTCRRWPAPITATTYA